MSRIADLALVDVFLPLPHPLITVVQKIGRTTIDSAFFYDNSGGNRASTRYIPSLLQRGLGLPSIKEFEVAVLAKHEAAVRAKRALSEQLMQVRKRCAVAAPRAMARCAATRCAHPVPILGPVCILTCNSRLAPQCVATQCVATPIPTLHLPPSQLNTKLDYARSLDRARALAECDRRIAAAAAELEAATASASGAAAALAAAAAEEAAARSAAEAAGARGGGERERAAAAAARAAAAEAKAGLAKVRVGAAVALCLVRQCVCGRDTVHSHAHCVWVCGEA